MSGKFIKAALLGAALAAVIFGGYRYLGLKQQNTPVAKKKARTVVMYSKPTCPYCLRALQFFGARGIPVDIIDIAGNPELRKEMTGRTNRTTVPQIFIGDAHVGGLDDLLAADKAGRLETLLFPREEDASETTP